jgi:hypothetical protein
MSALLSFDESTCQYTFTIDYTYAKYDLESVPNCTLNTKIISFDNNMLSSYVMTQSPFINNNNERSEHCDFFTLVGEQHITVMTIYHMENNLALLIPHVNFLSLPNIINITSNDDNYNQIFKEYRGKVVIHYSNSSVCANLVINLHQLNIYDMPPISNLKKIQIQNSSVNIAIDVNKYDSSHSPLFFDTDTGNIKLFTRQITNLYTNNDEFEVLPENYTATVSNSILNLHVNTIGKYYLYFAFGTVTDIIIGDEFHKITKTPQIYSEYIGKFITDFIELCINIQPIEDELIEEQLIEEQLIENELIEEQPIEDELIEDELIEDELIEDELIEDELIEDELIEEQPIEEQPIEEQPKEQLIEDELIEDELIEDELIENELIEDELIEDELIEDELIEDELIEEQPIEEQPIEEQPIEEQLIEDELIEDELIEDELIEHELIEHVNNSIDNSIQIKQHVNNSIDNSIQIKQHANNLSFIQVYNKMFFIMQGRKYVLNPPAVNGIMGSILTWDNVNSSMIQGYVYPAFTNISTMSLPLYAFDGYNISTQDMYTQSKYAMKTQVTLSLQDVNVDIQNTIFGPEGNSKLAPLDSSGKFTGPQYPHLFRVNTYTYNFKLNDNFKKWCRIDDGLSNGVLQLAVNNTSLYGKITLTYKDVDLNLDISKLVTCVIYVLPYSNLLIEKMGVIKARENTKNYENIYVRNAYSNDDRNVFANEIVEIRNKINNVTYCRIPDVNPFSITNFQHNLKPTTRFLDGFEYTNELNVLRWANPKIEIPYTFTAEDTGTYEAIINIKSTVFSRYAPYSNSHIIVSTNFTGVVGVIEKTYIEDMVVGDSIANTGSVIIYGENSDIALDVVGNLQVSGNVIVYGRNILDVVNEMVGKSISVPDNNQLKAFAIFDVSGNPVNSTLTPEDMIVIDNEINFLINLSSTAGSGETIDTAIQNAITVSTTMGSGATIDNAIQNAIIVASVPNSGATIDNAISLALTNFATENISIINNEINNALSESGIITTAIITTVDTAVNNSIDVAVSTALSNATNTTLINGVVATTLADLLSGSETATIINASVNTAIDNIMVTELIPAITTAVNNGISGDDNINIINNEIVKSTLPNGIVSAVIENAINNAVTFEVIPAILNAVDAGISGGLNLTIINDIVNNVITGSNNINIIRNEITKVINNTITPEINNAIDNAISTVIIPSILNAIEGVDNLNIINNEINNEIALALGSTGAITSAINSAIIIADSEQNIAITTAINAAINSAISGPINSNIAVAIAASESGPIQNAINSAINNAITGTTNIDVIDNEIARALESNGVITSAINSAIITADSVQNIAIATAINTAINSAISGPISSNIAVAIAASESGPVQNAINSAISSAINGSAFGTAIETRISNAVTGQIATNINNAINGTTNTGVIQGLINNAVNGQIATNIISGIATGITNSVNSGAIKTAINNATIGFATTTDINNAIIGQTNINVIKSTIASSCSSFGQGTVGGTINNAFTVSLGNNGIVTQAINTATNKLAAKIGSVVKANNIDGTFDTYGSIVTQVSSPIIGWNSIAKIDLPDGKWQLDGYCAFISNYTDLALVGFGLSDSSGNGELYPIENPIIVGQNNYQDDSQPIYPTILQYIGRTYGSETLNSGSAGTCQNMVVNGPVTYYLNYAVLDDTTGDTFIGSNLTINPLLSATRLG